MGKKLQDHPLLWGIIRRFLMAGAVSVTFGILYRWQNIKIDRLEFLLNAIITVSYTHLTLPTTCVRCRSRWSPYH